MIPLLAPMDPIPVVVAPEVPFDGIAEEELFVVLLLGVLFKEEQQFCSLICTLAAAAAVAAEQQPFELSDQTCFVCC